MDVLLNINHGEPPANPDIMKSVHVMADMPASERPKVSVASEAAMRIAIEKARKAKGADFSICDVVVPVKID
jgi:peptidylprolyl isomerase